jgi:hypothetical protein
LFPNHSRKGWRKRLLDSLTCSALEVINGKATLYRLKEGLDSPSLALELFEAF